MGVTAYEKSRGYFNHSRPCVLLGQIPAVYYEDCLDRSVFSSFRFYRVRTVVLRWSQVTTHASTHCKMQHDSLVTHKSKPCKNFFYCRKRNFHVSIFTIIENSFINASNSVKNDFILQIREHSVFGSLKLLLNKEWEVVIQEKKIGIF